MNLTSKQYLQWILCYMNTIVYYVKTCFFFAAEICAKHSVSCYFKCFSFQKYSYISISMFQLLQINKYLWKVQKLNFFNRMQCKSYDDQRQFANM